jgi:hypothetical protein
MTLYTLLSLGGLKKSGMIRRGVIPQSCASLSLWERLGVREKGAPALAGYLRSGAHESIVAFAGNESREAL